MIDKIKKLYDRIIARNVQGGALDPLRNDKKIDLNNLKLTDIEQFDSEQRIYLFYRSLMDKEEKEKGTFDATMEVFERMKMVSPDKAEIYTKIIDTCKRLRMTDTLAPEVEKLVVDLEAIKKKADSILTLKSINEVIGKSSTDIESFVTELGVLHHDYEDKKATLKTKYTELKAISSDYQINEVNITIPDYVMEDMCDIIVSQIKKIKDSLNDIDIPDSEINEAEAAVKQLEDLMHVLSNFLDKPHEYSNILDRVYNKYFGHGYYYDEDDDFDDDDDYDYDDDDDDLDDDDDKDKDKDKDKEQAKAKLYDELKEIILNKRKVLLDKMKALDFSCVTEMIDLVRKFDGALSSCTTLFENEKNEIADKVKSDVFLLPNADAEFEMALLDNDGLFDSLYNVILVLNSGSLVKDENSFNNFNGALRRVSTTVANLNNNQVLKAHNVEISFDEKNVLLTVRIPELSVSCTKRVVSQEKFNAYQQYQAKKVIEEFSNNFKNTFLDKMRQRLGSYIKLQAFDATTFDANISTYEADAKSKLMALGLSESDALDAIKKAKDQVVDEWKNDTKEQEQQTGLEFIETQLIPKFNSIRTAINELSALDPSSPEFATKYADVQKMIKDFIAFVDKDENKKYGIAVTYDEGKEEITLNFKGSTFDYTDCIMSVLNDAAKTYKASHPNFGAGAPQPGGAGAPQPGGAGAPQPGGAGAPQPGGAGAPQPGGAGASQPGGAGASQPGGAGASQDTDEEIRDQQLYVEAFDIINGCINRLNEINNNLITYEAGVGLTKNYIEQIIALEEEARRLDLQIVSLKTALAVSRSQYAIKYKKLLFANPTIKNLKFNEIKFVEKYENFAKKHDSLIVEAEMQIAELDEQRKNNPSEAVQITNQINLLLEFINSQNSMIGRCLVSECQDNNIDIVQALEQRREFKKDLREKLRQKAMDAGLHGNDDKKPVSGADDDKPDVDPVDPADDKKPVPGADDDKPLVDPSADKKPDIDPADGVIITSRQLQFNPKKKNRISKKGAILTDVDVLVVSVIKNGIKIKYSRDLAKKLNEVKARLALVNKKNHHIRKTAQLGIADEDTLVETELAFKTKDSIDPNDYKVEIRTDNGIMYEYDLADLSEGDKGRTL